MQYNTSVQVSYLESPHIALSYISNKLASDPKITNLQIAKQGKFVGLDTRSGHQYVSRLRKVLKWPPEARDRVLAGEVPWAVIDRLARQNASSKQILEEIIGGSEISNSNSNIHEHPTKQLSERLSAVQEVVEKQQETFEDVHAAVQISDEKIAELKELVQFQADQIADLKRMISDSIQNFTPPVVADKFGSCAKFGLGLFILIGLTVLIAKTFEGYRTTPAETKLFLWFQAFFIEAGIVIVTAFATRRLWGNWGGKALLLGMLGVGAVMAAKPIVERSLPDIEKVLLAEKVYEKAVADKQLDIDRTKAAIAMANQKGWMTIEENNKRSLKDYESDMTKIRQNRPIGPSSMAMIGDIGSRILVNLSLYALIIYLTHLLIRLSFPNKCPRSNSHFGWIAIGLTLLGISVG